MANNRTLLGGDRDIFPLDGLEHLYTMEVERRNLLEYSEAFDKASWSTVSGGTGTDPVVTPEAGVDPFGRNLATRVQLSKGAGSTTSDFSRLLQSFPAAVGDPYTATLWVKSNTEQTYDIRFNLSGAGTPTNHTVTTAWQRLEVRWTTTVTSPQFTLELRAGLGAISDTADLLIYGAMVSRGDTALSYVPTTNKQAVYDYSGNGRHHRYGDTGSAFICPVGNKHLSLPGTAGNNIRTENATGGTAYYTITYLDGSTEDGSTSAGTVVIGNATHSGNIVKIQVYDDSARTLLVSECVLARDAHGDVSRFTSASTGEEWTINQATATDTHDPTPSGLGPDFDGSDDYTYDPNGSGMNGGSARTIGAVGYPGDINSSAEAMMALTDTSEYLGVGWRFGAAHMFTNGETDTGASGTDPGGDALLTLVWPGSGDLSLYLNDNVDYTETPTGTNFANAGVDHTILGALRPASPTYLGPVQLAFSYSRALTPNEVRQAYRAARRILADRGTSI